MGKIEEWIAALMNSNVGLEVTEIFSLVKRPRFESSEPKLYGASLETGIGSEPAKHSGTTFTHHLWQLAQ
jgi:hypothetical protein